LGLSFPVTVLEDEEKTHIQIKTSSYLSLSLPSLLIVTHLLVLLKSLCDHEELIEPVIPKDGKMWGWLGKQRWYNFELAYEGKGNVIVSATLEATLTYFTKYRSSADAVQELQT